MQQNTLGNIAYEITNYLGNVNVVISDRKIWNATPNSAFKACVVSRTDYFPFGMEISSRTSNSDNYRFGYNGSDSYRKESDDETKGSGNSYTTEFRQYDPRIGRWLSLDPLMVQYPMMSPYVAFNNNPIYFVDPLGLEGECPGDPEKGYTCYDETHGETITHMGNGDWENTSKVISSNNEKIKNLESQFSAIESRISQNDAEIVKLKKEFNISVSNIKTLNSQLEQKQKEIENSVQNYYFKALSVSRLIDFNLNGLRPPLGSFGNPYPMMASGSCSSTSFAQPFMDIGQELIAGGLEMVGMDSEVAQYMSGGLMIFGTLATGKIKSGSFTTKGASVTLYRNFGWNELSSVKNAGGKFSIHPNKFQGKQFWVGESGMEMWTNSSFTKPFTAKITVPKSFVTPGSKNYIFMESNMMIDGFPGGTVLPSNLKKFNSAMKIDWIKY